MAEALKYGGDRQRKAVYAVVRKMWAAAVQARLWEEAWEWPESWLVGLVIPLWKRKGCRKDRGTWRGITLLSVGS
eukprot:257221-Lingulodinium_polyedra.AAC.1